MFWGAAGGAAARAAPAVCWNSFGFVWRGHEGSPSDGARIGREVLGAGDLQGVAPATGESSERSSFS